MGAGPGVIGMSHYIHPFSAGIDVLTNSHRGCVSGETISNLQEYLSKDKNGGYNWDMLDGWEELE